MLKTILVAYDGSEHADRALDMAAELALALDARLHLVSVSEPEMPALVLAPYGTIVDVPASDEQIAKAGAEVVERAKERLKKAGATLTESYVRRGDPVTAILSIAKAADADLVVMGRRGLGMLKTLALGSVSRSVTQQIKIPCLTVV